jgi:amino acid adenylation domain-containing protein
MLADSRVPVVVSRADLFDRLPERESTVDVLGLDTDAAALAAQPGTAPPGLAGPDSAAYVLYTSGSTGRPKGVVVAHRSVLRLVCGTDYLRFGPDERFGQVADASFDAITLEVWGALLHGGTVCVIPPEAVLTPGRLGEELHKHGVTSMFLTSALFNEIMASHPDSFDGLTNLLVGGDALNAARIRQLLAGPSAPRRLLNGYGPTEATTFAVVHHITDVPADAASVPIGRPIANTTAYVLDPYQRPVPLGVPGELYLGGPGVARGYADRPALTADHFVPDPYAGPPGSRLYRTGDVVRWRPGGVLDFLGRIDDQVKISGFRIEPGEVENALVAHPAVANAVVLVDVVPAGKRLVAYVVPAVPGRGPSGPELRSFLAERLPPYLVPAAYVGLAALPLTAHGKLDRAALPRPDAVRPELAVSFRAPTTPTEQRVADLCAELLGLDQVGLDDDFFALGGHSLLAMRVVSRVNQAWQVDVPLRRFLLTPTAGALATALDDVLAAGSDETGSGETGAGETGADRPAQAGPGPDRSGADWQMTQQLLAHIDDLTTEQVEMLLTEFSDTGQADR